MLGLGLLLGMSSRGGGGDPVNPATANLWADFDYSQGFSAGQWNDVSGNGHHATLLNTPTVDADGVFFDTTFNQSGKTAADAALVQPESIYLVVNQPSWANNGRFFDGDAANSGTLIKQDTTPGFKAYAGGYTAQNDDLVLNTWGVVCVVFNGASSLTQVNLGTPATGNCGAANMGGLTIAAKGDLSVFGRMRCKRLLVYGGIAHDAPTRASVITYLAALYGVSL